VRNEDPGFRVITFHVAPHEASAAAIEQAARAVLAGALVAGPTDTLYGVLADPHNEAAVARLFALKQRPPGQAVPLVAADLAQVEQYAGRLRGAARQLAGTFWPGPLTLLLPAWGALAPSVHGATGAVGVRVPGHPVTRALAAAVGWPVIATSANLSGESPPARPSEISRAVRDGLAVLVDAGRLGGAVLLRLVEQARQSEVSLARIPVIRELPRAAACNVIARDCRSHVIPCDRRSAPRSSGSSPARSGGLKRSGPSRSWRAWPRRPARRLCCG
jgi:L-threonylcarbamoyladenylate synthase